MIILLSCSFCGFFSPQYIIYSFCILVLSNRSCFLGTRLKLSDGFQYNLNANGSTPAEVMGIDYKSTLKPSLESFAKDLKESSMTKLEELIVLQQQSSDVAAKIKGKRDHLARLDSHINEVSVLKLIKFHFLLISLQFPSGYFFPNL